MKKLSSLTVLCLATTLLSGCGDPETKLTKKLAFEEGNYTYEERIEKGFGDTHYFSRVYNSVHTTASGKTPTFTVRYDVVNDMRIAQKEYWHHNTPQGVIDIHYEGELDMDESTLNELAKPIIDHMKENEMFHPEYGVDFVKTSANGGFMNPLIYNNADDDDFEIKEESSDLLSIKYREGKK